MSTEAQPVGEPETQPSVDVDSDQTSSGGDPTQGSQAPSSLADPELKERLNRVFSKGRADGINKGRREALEELFVELEVESVDEIKSRFSGLNPKQTEQPTSVQPAAEPSAPVPTPEQEDQTKIIRTLRTERTERNKELKQLQAEVARLRAQAGRAMEVDLKTRLLSLGAHDAGIDDLTRIVMDDLHWSEDGTRIEVWGEREDGTKGPTYQELDEYLAELPTSRSFYFRPRNTQGSGAAPDAVPKPTAPQGDTFQARLERLRRQRR